MAGFDGVFDVFIVGAGVMISLGILLGVAGVAMLVFRARQHQNQIVAVCLLVAALIVFTIGMYVAVVFSGGESWGEAALRALGSLDPMTVGLAALIVFVLPAAIVGIVLLVTKHRLRRLSSPAGDHVVGRTRVEPRD